MHEEPAKAALLRVPALIGCHEVLGNSIPPGGLAFFTKIVDERITQGYKEGVVSLAGRL